VLSEAAAQKRHVDHSTIARIYAALGEKDEAIKALEQACAARPLPLMEAARSAPL
jgi:hypothetical protein